VKDVLYGSSFSLGPYHATFLPGYRPHFEDKRRISESDLNAGTILLDQDLNDLATLLRVYDYLVMTSHYRSGLNDRSNEESFTHSLATGLVELAVRNPEFWANLQAVTALALNPRAKWAAAARAEIPQPPTPKRVVFNHRVCPIKIVEVMERGYRSAWGTYKQDLREPDIELMASLQGANKYVVIIHELLHFIHHSVGLKDSSTEKQFTRGQSRSLLRFCRQNPTFWTWWVRGVADFRSGRA
jgi:hypothetical protein